MQGMSERQYATHAGLSRGAVQKAKAAGRHLVQGSAAPVLRALLRAFEPRLSKSRLLVTSRHPFPLDGLEGGFTRGRWLESSHSGQ